jgi:hypothetical protein
VEGEPDVRGRPVSECKREEGGSWAALASWAGRGGGPAGEKKKEREESCWAGPRGEGERFRGLERFVFFSKTFQIFSNFKFKPFFINLFKLSKHFKASHQQTKTPCIQIMMRKHLLLLNY